MFTFSLLKAKNAETSDRCKILISHMTDQEDGDDKPRCEKKLVVPEKILEKTNSYLEENNDVKAFLEEFYQFTDKNGRTKENFVSLKDLYYGHYRDTGGTSSKSTFKYNMESNGFGYEIWKPYFDGKRITKRGFFGLKLIITGVDFIETSDLKNEVDVLDKY